MGCAGRIGLGAWAALLLCVAPGLGHADNWAEVKDGFSDDPAYAQSKAICSRVRGLHAPRADLPAPAELAALKGCDAEALYYGEGRPADPRQARLCAFAQAGGDGEGGSDEVFSGQTVLMMLYANGSGGRRDLDLALHYACNVDGAPAEIDGRVLHLAELKAKGPGKDPFDYCDDITSGLAMGYCAARGQTAADGARQKAIDALGKRVPAAAQPAFAALRKAAYAFADARSTGEVDMSGTARAAEAISAEEESRDAYVKQLGLLLDGKVPAGTPARAQAADAALNAMWRKVRAQGEHTQEFGTVTYAEVQASQRLWLKYRDAFLVLAKALGKPADGLAAALTEARTSDLKGLLPE